MRDLFGNPITDPNTGAQSQLDFGQDLDGNQPTPSGWKTPAGMIRMDLQRMDEQRWAAEEYRRQSLAPNSGQRDEKASDGYARGMGWL